LHFSILFFIDVPSSKNYTLSLHDALPISGVDVNGKDLEYEGEGLFARMLQHEVDHLDGYLFVDRLADEQFRQARRAMASAEFARSEEHTSELQSRFDLVCRLLLEKKKKTI